MDRATAAGYDVDSLLSSLAGAADLREHHRGRELHYRLLDACPGALTFTGTTRTGGPAGSGTSETAEDSTARAHPDPPPQQPTTPTGPSR